MAPTAWPVPPPATANAKSWLWWNATAGAYWTATFAPTVAADDAFIGWVVCDGTGVILTSSRTLGNGAEAAVPVPVGPVTGAGSDGVDEGLPDTPVFGVEVSDLDSQAAEITGLTFVDTSNVHSVVGGTFILYYTSAAEMSYVLAAAVATGDATISLTVTPTTLAAGDYIQIGAELLRVNGAISGGTVPVDRGQLGSSAATAAIGDGVLKALPRTLTPAWPRSSSSARRRPSGS